MPIGLALSGGGFRATLFHLGVMQYLHETDRIKDVRVITSVSGGSVMAAHLALRWAEYTGTAATFQAAAMELIDFIRSDVRGRTLRRALFFPWKSSTEWLEREYGRLFHGKELRNLFEGARAGDEPILKILGTNLTVGCLTSFSKEGVTNLEVDGAETIIATNAFPIARAVTASSAVPGFFEPVRIDIRAQGKPLKDTRLPTIQLVADGGVWDNLGLASLLTHSSITDQVIACDAGAPFDWETATSSLGGSLRAGLRSINILTERIRSLQESHDADLRPDVQRISITSIVPDGAHPRFPMALQEQLRLIRTDLDAFSRLEVASLVVHGERVAASRFGEPASSWSPYPGVEEDLEENGAQAMQDQLVAGRKRYLAPFSRKDPLSWCLALFLLTMIGGGLWAGLALVRRSTPAIEVVENHNRQLDYANEIIESARDELWFSGTHFKITLDNQQDILAAAVLRGVDLHFLMCDPESASLKTFASTLRHDPDGLAVEIRSAVKEAHRLDDRVRELARSRAKSGSVSRGEIFVRLYSQVPQGRLYMCDPGTSRFRLLYLPYLNLQVGTNAPAYAFRGASPAAKVYVAATKNHWQHSRPADPIP